MTSLARAVAALVVLLIGGHDTRWHAVRPGVAEQEMQMAERGPLSAVRVVVLRLDPALLRFALDTATREWGTRSAWTIDRIPDAGIVAFNAGQFGAGTPWGWLVRDGVEEHPPGSGTVAMAFVMDSAGSPALVMPGEFSRVRGHVKLAFQSYPALLAGPGVLPWELQGAGRGVDLEHRDSRLAIGVLADGSLIVALTRFTGLGPSGEFLRWGPTAVEMVEFMSALGCQRAMLLDGGISSQLAYRDTAGALLRWANLRAVPVGMVVTAAASH